jgi:hypothetical protein
VSPVRERLQLMYRNRVIHKFKQWDNLTEALKLKCQHKNCINEAKYNLNLCFILHYIIMVHGIFVQITI